MAKSNYNRKVKEKRMNKVYDLAEKITKTLSEKVSNTSKDTSLNENTKYIKMVTYGEIIDEISCIVTKIISEA